MAVSAIRNWWNSYQMDKSDSDNTDEDEEELAGRRQCKLFSTLAFGLSVCLVYLELIS